MSSGGNAADGEADVVEDVVAGATGSSTMSSRTCRCTPQKSTGGDVSVDRDDPAGNTQAHRTLLPASSRTASATTAWPSAMPPSPGGTRWCRCTSKRPERRARSPSARRGFWKQPPVSTTGNRRDAPRGADRSPARRRGERVVEPRGQSRDAGDTPPARSATIARTIGRRSIVHGDALLVDHVTGSRRARRIGDAVPRERDSALRARSRAGRAPARRRRRSSGRRRAPAARGSPRPDQSPRPTSMSRVRRRARQSRAQSIGGIAVERVVDAAPARCATARGWRESPPASGIGRNVATRSKPSSSATSISPPQPCRRCRSRCRRRRRRSPGRQPVLGHRAGDVRVVVLDADLDRLRPRRA